MGDRHRSSHRDRDHDDYDYDRRSSKRSRYEDEPDRRDKRRDRSRSPRRREKHSSSSHKRRETSEERRQRKAAKASAKEASRRANAEAALDLYGQGAGDDLGGSSQFVWHKKRQADASKGLSASESTARDEARRSEAQMEIEKLNRRRVEREREQTEREQEAARNAVASEDQAMRAWIAKEDEFYLQQSKKRAEIRVRERRAKPVDYLALNLKWSTQDSSNSEDEQDQGEGLDVDLEEPYAIFENITLEDTEELEQDIKMYLSLESNPTNLDFWRSMLLVCASALEEARTKRRLGSAYESQLRSHEALRAEFSTLLRGKTIEQLNGLQESVQRKLTSGEPIDVEYWEQLLKELIVHKAKSKLRDMHQIVLRNRLEQLRRQQRDEAKAVRDQLANSIQPIAELHPSNDMDEDGQLQQMGSQAREAWDASMEPPALTHLTNEDRALDLVEDNMDRLSLVLARRKVHSSRFVSRVKPAAGRGGIEEDDGAGGGRTKDAAAEAAYQAELDKGLDEDEELFNMEEELSKQTYVWEDKYRPRKPRYFNKVLTGFEWNKFNQTHYDADNPPPKVVMGYRMVLFYPDLIDKTKAPSFNVIKDKSNPDVATLVFKAGPPYEDIAFQIVNRDWEYSHKRGFRCSFDRGVLQLAFTFKRLHYRK